MPSLNPQQFGEQMELPGLAQSGERRQPAEWWHGTERPDWDEKRTKPTHVGTLQAATDRIPGRGDVHLLRLRDPKIMYNTPDLPVSDRFANETFHGEGWSERGTDLPTYDAENSGFATDVPREGRYFHSGRGGVGDVRGTPTRGLYYRNEGEDIGSISAVVPRGGKNLERVASFRMTPPTQAEDSPGSTRYAYADGRVAHQPRLFAVPMNVEQSKRRPVGEPRLERYR